jgi:hypothetical protein
MKKIEVSEAKNLQPYERTPLSPSPPYYTIQVDDDGWEKVNYYTNHQKVDGNSEGSEYIYILRNESMPGLFKIGYTYNDPTQRASQLFKTGVPTEFEIVHVFKCFNGMRIERAIHEKLKSFRVNKNREFFNVELDVASKVSEQMKEKYG